MRIVLAGSFLLLATSAFAQGPNTTTLCERLSSLKLPHTTVTLARVVDAGTFTSPAQDGTVPTRATVETLRTLPAFCRVVATLRPSDDSDIKTEIWLPLSGWNGKFQGIGNGGWGGSIVYTTSTNGGLADAVARGYAAASTDTGHAGSDGRFAFSHPEKLIDFAYRAVHEMTVQAKSIVNAFYGNAPRFSYWNACSGGGRQGLKEAQRYPADYDGIIAGAPALDWTEMMAHGLWVAHTTLLDPASYIPPAIVPVDS
jgi:tannase/feruloyl esterase